MATLKNLLEQAKAKRGTKSGRALAKLATDHGLTVHATQINHLLANTYKSKPSRQLLEAIAWLAQVPLEDAYLAAGLQEPGPPFADELPPDVDQLQPHQRSAVIGVIRGFLVDNRELADVRATLGADDETQSLAPVPELRTIEQVEAFLAGDGKPRDLSDAARHLADQPAARRQRARQDEAADPPPNDPDDYSPA